MSADKLPFFDSKPQILDCQIHYIDLDLCQMILGSRGLLEIEFQDFFLSQHFDFWTLWLYNM